MKATVLVTHLNDARVVGTITSALQQGPLLHEVLVADGGSSAAMMQALEDQFGQNPRVRILHLPGSVAQTRNLALEHIRAPVVAFLDSDETAPAGWLEALTRPILDGRAEFTGGPTKPPRPEARGPERYVNAEDAHLYRLVPNDLALLPMGNSAWKVELLRSIGGFDPRLSSGGEDYDVNLRALKSGARGVFVPEAVVVHDQSHLSSYRRILRRKYRYYVGATLAYLKNRALGQRARRSAARFRFRHPIDVLDLVLKPAALLRARLMYRRLFGPTRTA